MSLAAAVPNLARQTFAMLLSGRDWLAAALVLGLCATASADDILFENVRIFDGKGATSLSAPSNVLVKGNVIARISTDPIEAEGAERIAGNGRTLMPGLIDAHWHAMLIATTPARGDDRHRLRQSGSRRRGDGHADARLHHSSRRRRTGIRSQARDRPGHRRRAAHLSIRRHDHRNQRARRFPPDERPAAEDRRLVHPHGGKRRQHRRGQPRRGAFARPRAVHAGGRAAEGDGGRRRIVAAQPARRDHLHIARIAGGRRNCRELGHLCRRARLHAGSDRNVDRGGREVHRARLPDERGRRQADRGQGHLAEPAAASRSDEDRPPGGFGRASQGR